VSNKFLSLFRRKMARNDWPCLEAKIVEADIQHIQEQNGRSTQARYQPFITLQYVVADKEYCFTYLLRPEKDEAKALIHLFGLGSTQAIRYNPDSPSEHELLYR
jgi:hypothetical protein